MRSTHVLFACVASAAALGGESEAELRLRVAELESQVESLQSVARPKITAAEKDASLCNNNGFYYDDVKACQCFSCFTGKACETLVEDCAVVDMGGNPYMYEQYWRNVSQSMTEPGYYRSPYAVSSTVLAHEKPTQGSLLPVLKDTIVALHEKINNIAHMDRKNVVVGSGATELIGAAMYACKQKYGAGKHMHVYVKAPYYNGYTGNLLALGVYNLSFTQDTTLDPSTVIEFVTYPNNPTGTYRKPVYGGRAACTIHDQVYWWPSLNNMTEGGAPLDTSISLFSMSKLSGHAGTRFGWALVDDADLTSLMGDYVEAVQIHVSIDAQYRTFNILNYLLAQKNNEFFEWGRQMFLARWKLINEIFNPATQTRFIQHAVSDRFYAWVECTRPADRADCDAAFRAGLIAPAAGGSYGGSKAFVRLEMVQPDANFNLLVQRLRKLVAE